MSETRKAAGVLFLAALISAAWQLFRFPGAGFGRYYETMAIARSLAAGHGFANPFGSMDTGPTAHLAPLYPFLLSGLIRVFGDTPQAGMAAALLAILTQALHAVLLIPVSQLLFRDAVPGVWAAAFAAVVPIIRVYPQWEAIYAAAAALLFGLAAARLLRSRLRRTVQGSLAGALCGVLLLLNPALITVCAAWLVFLLFRQRVPARACATVCLAFVAAAALVCTPWTLRNSRRLGAVFFVRDNLGLELYTSNADCADARDAENHRNGCHALQPNQSAQEAALVREMGEAGYNRYRLRTALDWIRAHPGRFRRLTLQRFREFWFPSPEAGAVYEYSLWLVTGLSLAGLYFLLRERNSAALFLVAVSGSYPVMYYLVQSSTRFRFPILWMSLLPAALGAERIVRHLRSDKIRRNARRTDIPGNQNFRQRHGG